MVAVDRFKLIAVSCGSPPLPQAEASGRAIQHRKVMLSQIIKIVALS